MTAHRQSSGRGEAPPARLYLRRVLRRTAQIWRRDWIWLAILAIAVNLPPSALESLLEQADVDALDNASLYALIGGTVAILSVHTLGDLFLQGVVAAQVTERGPGGGRPSLGQVARNVPYLRLIGADILVAVGFVLGSVLLVVPGIVFLAFFWLTPTLIKIEHRGVFSAFRRSARLVRGQFWRVLVVLAAITLIEEAVSHQAKELLHTFLGDLLSNVLVSAVIGPIEALLAVVTALELIALAHGREPAAA